MSHLSRLCPSCSKNTSSAHLTRVIDNMNHAAYPNFDPNRVCSIEMGMDLFTKRGMGLSSTRKLGRFWNRDRDEIPDRIEHVKVSIRAENRIFMVKRKRKIKQQDQKWNWSLGQREDATFLVPWGWGSFEERSEPPREHFSQVNLRGFWPDSLIRPGAAR